MKPPVGYADLMADAEATPMTGDYDEITVPKVGKIRARRPMPRSAAALAMAANSKASQADRVSYLNLFAADHLDDDEQDRLLFEMTMDELPADSMQRVAKAIATWGTGRPYTAVLNLAVIVGHHWRMIRAQLTSHGIPDPLSEMRSLHALLDFAEKITMESLARSGEGQDAHKQAQRAMDSFMFQLYSPAPGEREDGDDSAAEVVPAGFGRDEVEDSFDNFMTAVGGKP